MNQSKFCEQCGAPLTPAMRFCEACGKPVEPTVQPSPPSSDAAPAMSAERSVEPPSVNRGVLVFAIAGVVVVLVCIAVGVVGFMLMQNQPNVPGALPASSPQIAVAPTPIARGNVPPPTDAPPPTVTARPQLSPTAVEIPNVCWITVDDLRILTGAPADFTQPEGVWEWWGVDRGTVNTDAMLTSFEGKNGKVDLSCSVYSNSPDPATLIPLWSDSTIVDLPKIGNGSIAYQIPSRNLAAVHFIKGNVRGHVALRGTAPYVTLADVAKLANLIAERVPSQVSVQLPSPLPQTADESGFSKYLTKFEIGKNDPFVAGTTFTAADDIYALVETVDLQQRYSLWITDGKQSTFLVYHGIPGTRILDLAEPYFPDEYTVHLEIAGVIYARRLFTIK